MTNPPDVLLKLQSNYQALRERVDIIEPREKGIYHARVEKELIFGATVVKPGVTAPGQEILQVGALAVIFVPTLAFDPTGGGADQEAFLVFHMPFDLDTSVPVEFHLMWIPDPNWVGGDYFWSLDYIIKKEDASEGDADRTIGALTTIFEEVTPANANDFIETEFSTTIVVGEEEVIYARLYLDRSESGANDDGHVTFVEICYTSNKLGEEV